MAFLAALAVLGLLTDFPFAPADFPAAAQDGDTTPDPMDIPESVARIPDTLEVRFGDGRLPLKAPIRKRADGAFLRLGDVGRICGQGFVWNPDTYKGRIDVDSVSVSFLVDSPLVWTRREMLQLPSNVVYAENQMWIPLDFIPDVLLPIVGERMIYDDARAQLLVGAKQPWIQDLEFDRSGKRLEVRIRPRPARDYQLLWDPAGELLIDVHGLHLPPGYNAPRFRDRGVRDVSVEPTGSGFRVRLELDPVWVGARPENRDEDLHISLTQNIQDVKKSDYSLLTSYLPRSLQTHWGSRIVLEVGAQGSGNSDENHYLDQLSSELANQLEDRFNHQVVFVPDRRMEGRTPGPAGTPEMPSVPDADIWIGLRLERYASSEARDFLLVTSGQSAQYERLGETLVGVGAPLPTAGGEQVLSPPSRIRNLEGAYRMVPWGQAPRLERSASQDLARLLAAQLKGELRFRPVRTVQRPARIFRGLSMPAVLIYPAVRADEKGRRALADRDQVELVAKSLAFGIDEFLRRQESP